MGTCDVTCNQTTASGQCASHCSGFCNGHCVGTCTRVYRSCSDGVSTVANGAICQTTNGPCNDGTCEIGAGTCPNPGQTPNQITNGSPCPGGGTCRNGTCCHGCWRADDSTCLAADVQTDDACGTGGAACGPTSGGGCDGKACPFSPPNNTYWTSFTRVGCKQNQEQWCCYSPPNQAECGMLSECVDVDGATACSTATPICNGLCFGACTGSCSQSFPDGTCAGTCSGNCGGACVGTCKAQ